MKKYFLVLVCLGLFALSAHSQLRFGVKGGLNLSGVSGNNVDDFVDNNVTGFQLGASLEWMIKGKYGLEGGLSYSERGMKFKGGDRNNVGYIDVPVNFRVKFPVSKTVKPYVNAGPYISFKISGDDNFDGMKGSVDDQWKAQSFGAGLNFGGGVEFLGFLQIGANYGLGMTDNFKESDGDYKVKDRTWSVTATVYF